MLRCGVVIARETFKPLLVVCLLLSAHAQPTDRNRQATALLALVLHAKSKLV